MEYVGMIALCVIAVIIVMWGVVKCLYGMSDPQNSAAAGRVFGQGCIIVIVGLIALGWAGYELIASIIGALS